MATQGGTQSTDDNVVFNLYDQADCSGEEQKRQLAQKMYQGQGDRRSASWFSLLFRGKGSIIVKVFPISLFGGLIAYCLVTVNEAWDCPEPGEAVFRAPGEEAPARCFALPELNHPFVVQIFGIILSFVIVARNNVAVNRYFSGMEAVHTMSSRWIDSFTSLMGFLRASMDLHPPGSKKQEACVGVGLACLHWGTLAHALAVNSLQVTQLGLDEKIWAHRVTTLEPPANLTLSSEEGGGQPGQPKDASRSRVCGDAMSANKRVSITAEGIPRERVHTKAMRELGKLGVYGRVSEEETSRLHGATDKVAIVLMWMEEAVSRAQVQGVLLIAPPIMARVYNELGSGLEGFNGAFRIALVPFPFCFSQMIGWCLVVFVVLCPMVAFVFTGGEILTSVLTFCSLMGFWGLNRIALELENPFGCEVNHLPLAELHHAYVEAIGEMHIHPMPEYKWHSQAGAAALPQLRRNLIATK